MSKKRPARRWFGRPKDGPGPQETYEGQFQLPTTQAPDAGSSHQTFQVGPPSTTPTSPPTRGGAPASERERIRRDGAGSLRRGQRRPSVTAARDVPSTASAGRLEAGSALDAGPPKRRRPSVVGHRATQSHPIVPTVQAAGGNFNRSHSSSVLASEMSTDAGGPIAGPSSWPRVVHAPSHARPDGIPPTLLPAYRGLDRQTPGTLGSGLGRGWSPPGLSSPNLVDTPSSTGSPSLMSPYHLRHGSTEFSEASPTDTSSWHYPSPAPHTPSSLRGASIPPSVHSDPSPFMGMLFGDFDFSPELEPTDTGPEPELPPLTPDQIPEHSPWADGSRQPHTAVSTTTGYHPDPFGSTQYSQSNIPAPLFFPGEIFGSSQDAFAFSNVSHPPLQTSARSRAQPLGPHSSGSSTQTARPPDI